MLKEHTCKLSNVKCHIILLIYFRVLALVNLVNCNLLVNIVTCYFVIVSYKYCINLSVSSVLLVVVYCCCCVSALYPLVMFS